MHAAVLASFVPSSEEPSTSGRVLWRVDSPERSKAVLYVVSPAAPDLTHMVEQAGWPTTGTWDTRDYRPLLDRLATGQTWAFRLTANPVRHGRVKDSDEHTKPRGHVTVDQQQQWFLTRTESQGFDVATGSDGGRQVLVRDRRTVRFRREGATVTIAMATFDGLLRVTDPDALRTALISGIGRAKGYGCGLLTLAPR
jgi:CRISPR system Cascade subunit CasE